MTAILFHPIWDLPDKDFQEIGLNISLPSPPISHAELAINNRVFFQWCWNGKNIRTLEKAYDQYLHQKKSLFYKINLITTSDDREKLNEAILQYNSYENSCMGSVAKVLKENTSITIPYPIDQLPTCSALFLTAKYLLGKLRIIKPQVESIERNGSLSWSNIGRITFLACAESAAIPILLARRVFLAGLEPIQAVCRLARANLL